MAQDDIRRGPRRDIADLDAEILDATSDVELEMQLFEQQLEKSIQDALPSVIRELDAQEKLEELEGKQMAGRAAYKAKWGEEPVLPQERRSPLHTLIDYLSFGEFGLTSAIDEFRQGGDLFDVGKAYLHGAKEPFTNRAHKEKTIEEYMRRDLDVETGDIVGAIPVIGKHLPKTASELGLMGHSLGSLGVFEDPEVRKKKIDAMNIPEGAKSALSWLASWRPNQGGLMDIDDVASFAFLASVFTDPLGALSRGPKAVGRVGGTVREMAVPTIKKGGKAEMGKVAYRMGDQGEELIPISKQGQDRLYDIAEEASGAARAGDKRIVDQLEGVEYTQSGRLLQEVPAAGGGTKKVDIPDDELMRRVEPIAEKQLIEEMGTDWAKSSLAAPRDLRVGIPFTSAKIPIGRPLRRIAGKVAEPLSETRAWQWASDNQRFYNKVGDALGRALVPGWDFRDLPGAKEMFDMVRHADDNMSRRLINEMSREKAFRDLGRLGKSNKAWRRIYRSIQDPEFKLTDEKEIAAKKAFNKWIKNIEDLDDAMGTLPEGKRKPKGPNGENRYVPLFLRGGNEKHRVGIKALQRGNRMKAPSDFYHHDIDATFDSIEEVYKWNDQLRDMGHAEMEPVLDGIEVLARRLTNLSRAGAHRQMYNALKMQYGVSRPEAIKSAFNDAAELVDAGHAATGTVVQTARDIMARWGNKGSVSRLVNDLAGETPEVKKEVLRQILLDVDSVAKQDDFQNLIGGLVTAGKFGEVEDILPSLAKAEFPGHIERTLGVKNKQYLVPEGLAKHLDGMDNAVKSSDATGGLLEMYDRFLNWQKILLTLPFPAFHAVNVYSSMAMALSNLGGVIGPRFFRNYARMAGGSDEILETLGRKKYTGAEVRAAMENLGVEMDVGDALQLTKLDTPVKRTGMGKRALFKYGHMMSTKWENVMRKSLFVEKVQRGMSPMDAAAEVRKQMFDYGDLTTAERSTFRRFFPFYGWLRKSYESVWRQLADDPFKLSLQLRPFRRWSEDREGMVSYREGGLVLRTNRDGKTFEAVEGIKLQPLDFNTLDFGNFRRTALNLITMMTPIASVSAELISKRNLRGDYPLYRERSQSLGKIIEVLEKTSPSSANQLKEWLGHNRVARDGVTVHTFDPVMLRLFTMLSFSSRIQSQTASMLAAEMGPEAAEHMSQIATGTRVGVLSVMDEYTKRVIEGNRQMSERGSRKGAAPQAGRR